MNRRTFLGVVGATTLGAVTMSAESVMAQGTPTATPDSPSSVPSPMNFSGSDLTGWETVVGDGIYAPAGVAAVALSDIATIDAGTHSSLLMNVNERPIMAHNIAFNRIVDDTLFDYNQRTPGSRPKPSKAGSLSGMAVATAETMASDFSGCLTLGTQSTARFRPGR